MITREGPLEKFSNFRADDLTARLIVHYFFQADFLFRDYRRVKSALARQKRRTRWRASQETTYLRLWLAALFTVVEGFKILKLKDSEIELLLTSAHVDSLRRFRNATFHYQKDPIKHVQFFVEDGVPTDNRLEWAEKLHAAFDRFQRDYRVEVTVRNVMKARGVTDIVK